MGNTESDHDHDRPETIFSSENLKVLTGRDEYSILLKNPTEEAILKFFRNKGDTGKDLIDFAHKIAEDCQNPNTIFQGKASIQVRLDRLESKKA